MTPSGAIVVGAGPAGLATAIGLRQLGWQVRILERASGPQDKACGEALMPNAQAHLKALGVSCGGHTLRSLTYIDPQGRRIRAAFPEGQAPVALRRTVLSERLRARAQQLGVAIEPRCPVTRIDAEGVHVGARRMMPALIVGADGLHSKARAWVAPARQARRTEASRFGVRQHYDLAPWTDGIEVHWHADGEAYVTPVSDRCVGVAFLSSVRPSSWDALLARFPALQRRLRGVAVVSRMLGSGPLRQRCRRLYRERVALVGDAAGYVDALTGEGIALALGDAAALVSAVRCGGLSAYPAAQRRNRRLPETLIHGMLGLRRAPQVQRRALAALHGDPALFQDLVWLNGGLISLGQVRWRRLLGFGGRLVWPRHPSGPAHGAGGADRPDEDARPAVGA